MKTIIKILLFCCLLEAFSTSVSAQNEDRIYSRRPFDRITLDAENENAVLEILPLEFRAIPPNQLPNDTLAIRVFPGIEREYEVAWKHIEKMEFFEGLVLAEAEKYVEQENYDVAYDYYEFLLKSYPQTENLNVSIQDYYWKHAHHALKSGRLDEAFSLLVELRRMNAARPGLTQAVDRVLSDRISHFFSQEDYHSARLILQNAVESNPRQISAGVRQWQQKFMSSANEKKTEAIKLLEEGNYKEAAVAAKKMMEIWPEIEDGQVLSKRIASNYPMVIVGVMQGLENGKSTLDHWPARRMGRLLERRLVEITGYGSEGSRYFCPLGRLSRSQSDNSLLLEISRKNGSTKSSEISGYELSRHLLSADIFSDVEKALVYKTLFSGVSVENVYNVHFHLKRSYVRPETALQLISLTQDLQPSSSNKPYFATAQEKDETRFLLNDEYSFLQPKQPREIIERLYNDPREAVQALKQGDIDVLDQVIPAVLPAVRSDERFVLRPYAVPSVHVLIPNYQRPLPANRNFRRAILYGINRRAILDQAVLLGNDIEGCRLVSGPFPAGASRKDPLAYAYDEDVIPRPYEPTLALTLADAAYRELLSADNDDENKEGKNEVIIIGHPASPVPRMACRAIVKYLEAVGINCTLFEFSGGETSKRYQECDFYYTELYMSEPIYDATLLLGAEGIVQSPSRYLQLAVEKLFDVTNWREARTVLNRLHKIVYDEATVIPLWQLINHLAYHPRVQGIGEKPVNFYQSIEHWQIAP